ncbi:hypothetical protein ACI8OI_004233 [Salmonella enterica]
MNKKDLVLRSFLLFREKLALSLWLLLGEVQIFSPHLMDGM